MLSEKLAELVQINKDDRTLSRVSKLTKDDLKPHSEEIKALRLRIRSIVLPKKGKNGKPIQFPSPLYEKVVNAKRELTKPGIGYRLYIVSLQSDVLDTIDDADDYADVLIWERETL